MFHHARAQQPGGQRAREVAEQQLGQRQARIIHHRPGPAEAVSRPAVHGPPDRHTLQRLDGCLSRLPLHPAHNAGRTSRRKKRQF